MASPLLHKQTYFNPSANAGVIFSGLRHKKREFHMMYKVLLMVLATLISISSHGSGQSVNVTFLNNSSNLLKCSTYTNGKYTPFLRLHPEQSKSIAAFAKGSALRCWHQISSNSSTPLTYFNVNQAGIYDLLMEKVECGRECSNVKSRWATIASLPSGEAIYNKMEKYNK